MEFLIVLQWTMTLQIGKGIMMANLDMSGERRETHYLLLQLQVAEKVLPW